MSPFNPAIVAALLVIVVTASVTHARTLRQARAGFHTHLITYKRTPDIVQTPPSDELNLVYYKSPVGQLPAYVSPPPTSGKRYPAIIWFFGGFDNGIDSTAWFFLFFVFV